MYIEQKKREENIFNITSIINNIVTYFENNMVNEEENGEFWLGKGTQE